jgi:hypothetical protein
VQITCTRLYRKWVGADVTHVSNVRNLRAEAANGGSNRLEAIRGRQGRYKGQNYHYETEGATSRKSPHKMIATVVSSRLISPRIAVVKRI